MVVFHFALFLHNLIVKVFVLARMNICYYTPIVFANSECSPLTKVRIFLSARDSVMRAAFVRQPCPTAPHNNSTSVQYLVATTTLGATFFTKRE